MSLWVQQWAPPIIAFLFFIALLILFERVGRKLSQKLAPPIGRMFARITPAQQVARGISIPPGFNAIVGSDAGGSPRTADTFEEWLDHCVPELRRSEYDTFVERTRFAFYKHRKPNRVEHSS